MKKCCRNCEHAGLFLWRGLDGKPKTVFTCNEKWDTLATEIKNPEAYTSCKDYREYLSRDRKPRPTKKEIIDHYE